MQMPESMAEPSRRGTELVPEERTKILSSRRLKLNLSLMVLILIGGLLGLIWLLVEQIFDRLEPNVRQDLLWKTECGVSELSRSTELGILTGDAALLAVACQRYTGDHDVVALTVMDAKLERLYSHGESALITPRLLSGEAGKASLQGEHLAAWLPVQIEGARIGTVALVISTQRLQAGAELRRRILAVAVGGLLTALLVALAFVNLRIVPVLRLTEAAFVELAKKTHAALESSRLKGEFLANVSHEIRTPLNGIIGIVGLMLKMPLTGSLRHYVHVLDVSSRGLLTIVSDVLDFSKIEAGKLEIIESPCEPGLIAWEVAELYAQRAHEKGLELICNVRPSVPETCAIDGDKVRQVMANLVGNAIKFTAAGQVLIEVDSVATEPGLARLQVDVLDTGIGIGPADRERLFQAFSQVDGSSVRNHGGTGLGLVISKRLVEAMGGEIGLDSTPGKGSRFWFRLPAKAESRPREYVPITGARRVLVVDGNDTYRSLAGEQLARWGVHAETAASGLEGLDRLQSQAAGAEAFDAVLVAEMTNDITAEEFLALKHECGLTAPAVLLRRRGPQSSQSAFDFGASAVLDKPIRPSELYATVLTVLDPTAKRSTAPSAEPEAPVSSGAQRRVLIVDDNEINRFVAAELVKACGFACEFASNGREALEAVCAEDFALVLMDCQMPSMDGYTATRHIREREGSWRHTPIVALTAHALAGERERCTSAGMDGYVTKPIRAEVLRELLVNWTASEPPRASGGDAATSNPVAPEPDDSAPSGHLPDLAAVDRSPELIELFVSRTPELLRRLEQSLAAGSAEDTHRAAHKLKGSCLAIGAPRMANAAEKMQLDSQAGDLRAASEQLVRLRAHYAELERQLRPRASAE
jgi:signal transduction histidine kinase/CheY-like chemotaxis protein